MGKHIPPRSPYQAGDRIHFHGCPAGTTPTDRAGYTGTVTGHLGSTILTGDRDDGGTWAERWGSLEAADTARYVEWCPTCQAAGRPTRKPARRRRRRPTTTEPTPELPGQLPLF